MQEEVPEDWQGIKELNANYDLYRLTGLYLQAVSAPPHEGDPLLSTTVLPYLEALHFPSPSPSQPASEPDLEFSRGQSRSASVVDESVPDLERPNSAPHNNFESRLVRKKSKTTSCMKLKNGCKTQ